MVAVITRGHTYGATDTVTNSNLHSLVDDATIASLDQSNLAASSGVTITSGSAPSDTDALWRDSGNSNVIKYYTGSAWALVSGAGTAELVDADADTKIQVEESADEDIIRMDVGANANAFVLDANGILTLVNQSGARAQQSASDQTVATTTAVAVVLDSEDWDIQGEFASNDFTVTVSGLYLITGFTAWNGGGWTSDQWASTQIRLNDVTSVSHRSTQSGGHDFSHSPATILQCVSTDTLGLWVQHAKGSDAVLEQADFAVYKLA
jgi:hypothetical protein